MQLMVLATRNIRLLPVLAEQVVGSMPLRMIMWMEFKTGMTHSVVGCGNV